VAADLRGVAVLEASQMLGQHLVEGVRQHGQQHVEVDLDEDPGGKGVDRAYADTNIRK
jgi:hypothetical protein